MEVQLWGLFEKFVDSITAAHCRQSTNFSNGPRKTHTQLQSLNKNEFKLCHVKKYAVSY
jgi:hypothetical protein